MQVRKMDKRIISIILVTILALIPCVPALAEGNSTVTITMATDKYVDITLDKTAWNIGDVEPNTEYMTTPTWCTITNEGNCVVNIRIKGANAECDGSTYTWALSSNNTTAVKKYALLYHISYDSADSYTSITTIEAPMKKANGDTIQLIGNSDNEQFGLKLLTPKPDTTVSGTGYFLKDKAMEATITISAVVAS